MCCIDCTGNEKNGERKDTEEIVFYHEIKQGTMSAHNKTNFSTMKINESKAETQHGRKI